MECYKIGLSLVRRWSASSLWIRSLRSDAALEAIAKASEEKVPNIVLYNYPSFSGAYSALFAHLFHALHNIPCLILPFSSVEPLRLDSPKIYIPFHLFYSVSFSFTMGFYYIVFFLSFLLVLNFEENLES